MSTYLPRVFFEHLVRILLGLKINVAEPFEGNPYESFGMVSTRAVRILWKPLETIGILWNLLFGLVLKQLESFGMCWFA